MTTTLPPSRNGPPSTLATADAPEIEANDTLQPATLPIGELPEPPRTAPPPAAHAGIVVASYNIHGGIGVDGRFLPKRIARVLAELDADIVALQEVESRTTGFDMLGYLRDATGYHAIPGPTLIRPDGEYGNALLTRFPPSRVRQIDLSVDSHEPRGAIDATLSCRLGREPVPLRVIATHLGLWPGERRIQVRRLLTSLAEQRGLGTVLLGDVNEWFLWGRPLRWLHAYFEGAPHVATFPSRLPLFALDRIWSSPRALLASIRRHESPLARLASDHLPLVAALSLDETHLPPAQNWP
ncbi:endonuclease/exonuclease/phosphatase family protein [Cupriavidus sp. AU9028]|uniref:endonuclease/exonuclease/phosphatase family protein n=1 Tax=Cupriavidus sp. AU9028 TaxID=2871157 RepID=UPI001C986A51|nr:endonuclease/exonuclease/phosphatase family protein [Cupriavidus sp. AU9028]MBY4898391.1 endonuclease/exonuclease/phosphatase family protein [Cupriavidus sp. AU9028]